jgi:hypothetical protein
MREKQGKSDARRQVHNQRHDRRSETEIKTQGETNEPSQDDRGSCRDKVDGTDGPWGDLIDVRNNLPRGSHKRVLTRSKRNYI